MKRRKPEVPLKLNATSIDVSLRRGRNEVTLTVDCGSPLAAAVCFDDIARALKTGTLRLKFVVDPKPIEENP